MTKYLFFFSILGMLLFSSCSALMEDFDKTNTSISSKSYDINKIRKDINSADYDVTNLKVMNKLDEYKGKIVSCIGSANYQPALGEFENLFVLSGSNQGYLVRFIVRLDKELIKQTRIDQNLEIIDKGKIIRIFGIVTGMQPFISDDGIKREIPTMDALIIFNPDDFNYRKPLWTSKRYNK